MIVEGIKEGEDIHAINKAVQATFLNPHSPSNPLIL
jgi:hypothetical protein